jgi:hypothetical protein
MLERKLQKFLLIIEKTIDPRQKKVFEKFL